MLGLKKGEWAMLVNLMHAIKIMGGLIIFFLPVLICLAVVQSIVDLVVKMFRGSDEE